MKNLLFSGVLLMLSLSVFSQGNTAREDISEILNSWHRAAAEADFEAYFDLMADDAVFIGTDATENWQKSKFASYAKPHFDRGEAWDFESLERNIFTSENEQFAWFDELLDTHMGICRGSGVLKKEGDDWKIRHYVLSATVPNENMTEVTLIKKKIDEYLISEINEKNKK